MFSADRILAIRKSKGFSQELLAEHSGVSLRTIQRVEQGGTMPRGHTLNALATALSVSLEDFRAEPAPVVAPLFPADAAAPAAAPAERSALRSDPDFLQLLNLSALSLLVLPLLNIIVPLVLWRRRGQHIRHAAEVGRRVVGFQILWQLGCFLAYGLLLLGYQAANALQLQLWRGGFLAVFILSYLLNIAAVVYYAGRLRRGDLAVYPIRL
ncbi:XRE family transcriptional regulator [Hymenobacter lapidiphilus]|uniref:helix-turn-helix domain-containing protein n=1 Tax=Hymenobacter sp. CCM 8763 TaxID=2303334 RepID=UPI000E3538D4|nr:helix-turn-helix transcriptional regulator [Hymenobacter sp. CCM 8763]RFP65038.1 XRE family transcriptional regulator [Hymenobacter sp. CCM 8763]